ncbi:hypothetical protein, partial [Caballeronia catudaia]|uniref:hypothetical protein n=1 Tax=Caballeronia catudaia TaxID=1777136 RepID=UPI000B0F5F45
RRGRLAQGRLNTVPPANLADRQSVRRVESTTFTRSNSTSAKDVKFHDGSRTRIVKGVNVLADAVKGWMM